MQLDERVLYCVLRTCPVVDHGQDGAHKPGIRGYEQVAEVVLGGDGTRPRREHHSSMMRPARRGTTQGVHNGRDVVGRRIRGTERCAAS